MILEPRPRIDQALYAVVMEAYINGVSTRAVDDLVTAPGIEPGISKWEVSRICAGLDETLATFRTRPLHHTRFPYPVAAGDSITVNCGFVFRWWLPRGSHSVSPKPPPAKG